MGKKVLLSVPDYSSFYPGVYRALNYLGFEVRNFDYRKFTPKEKLLTVLDKKTMALESLNQRLCEVASAWKPEIFLTIKGETIYPETLEIIRKAGATTINWFPDGLWTLDLIMKLVSKYDIFLHFDSLVSDLLRKKGHKNVQYLPYAANIIPSDKPPQYHIKKYPVSFIGNYYTERENYFKKIANANFYLWGEKLWQKTSLSSNYQGVCQYSKVRDILSESRICVNLHYQQTKSNGANLRVYESTVAGSCLLTDFKKDLGKMYRLGEEVITYEGERDFINKLQFLVAKPELTMKIGERGYHRTKSEHTYIHRIKEILGLIGG